MKILCLHGNGMNSNVMKLQTASLRHELEDDHEYEFVEAVIEVPMAEGGGVEALSSPDQSFYAYYDPADLETLRQSIDQLDEYVRSEGPFDAVMGFSTGAVLAAVYLSGKSGGHSPFRCGLFLSSAACEAEIKYLGIEAGAQRNLIRVPTVHIWGSNDTLAPTGGEELSHLCDPALRFTLIHDGGHELPRGSDLTKAVHVIRRTFDLADH